MRRSSSLRQFFWRRRFDRRSRWQTARPVVDVSDARDGMLRERRRSSTRNQSTTTMRIRTNGISRIAMELPSAGIGPNTSRASWSTQSAAKVRSIPRHSRRCLRVRAPIHTAFSDSTVSSKPRSAIAWQFGHNSWVHPYVSGGIVGDRERQRTFTPEQYQYLSGRVNERVLLVPQSGSPVTTVHRVGLTAGAGTKFYMSARSFFTHRRNRDLVQSGGHDRLAGGLRYRFLRFGLVRVSLGGSSCAQLPSLSSLP